MVSTSVNQAEITYNWNDTDASLAEFETWKDWGAKNQDNGTKFWFLNVMKWKRRIVEIMKSITKNIKKKKSRVPFAFKWGTENKSTLFQKKSSKP